MGIQIKTYFIHLAKQILGETLSCPCIVLALSKYPTVHHWQVWDWH